ncbi:MAG: NUDIX domain-containing protein [Streptosporangiales bacterium]|nr:NUDIX domain-containing protein [Streptosporangiales bacterium]
MRRAAVAIALVEDANERPCFLLTRRSASLRTHSGQWALPGGHIDDGEGAEEAARRELHEELGLALPESSVLGRLDDYASRSGYIISPIVLWAGFHPRLRPRASEVAQVFLVPLSDLDVEPRLTTIPESEAPVIQLPLLGTFIYAPTAAVLYQFGELVLHGRQTRVAHFEQPVFAWR